MKSITIDTRMINSSGIGTYIQHIVPRVIANLPDFKFNLIGTKEDLDKLQWTQRNNVFIVDDNSSIYTIKEQINLRIKTPKGTDLFWSPHYNIPLFWKGKLLVTVHDVFHLSMTRYTSGVSKKLFAQFMFNSVKRNANSILTVSKFTQEELQRLVGVDKKRIKVTYNGIDKSWFSADKQKAPHDQPYLVYVGNIKPHKNLINLLDAFQIIKNKIPHDLVIIGKKDGFITGDKGIGEKAENMSDRIHFTGHVDDELLKQYVSNADCLIFPSYYEGFGLPPLEAMASGCPAIVSNRASIPEICGDAALYIDPDDPKDISSKILNVVFDQNLKENLISRGRQKANSYSWEDCANETVKTIKSVLRI